MIKKLLCILWCVVCFSTTVCAAEYPGLLRIVEVEDYVITGEDANGFTWRFINASEDWMVNDLCAVIYEDNDTPIIFDDIIKQTRYVGYVELYQ